jgi:hypothetical protein
MTKLRMLPAILAAAFAFGAGPDWSAPKMSGCWG